MIFICKNHVKKGVTQLNVPHIKKVVEAHSESCIFCDEKASYKLYYSVPFLTRYDRGMQVQKTESHS